MSMTASETSSSGKKKKAIAAGALAGMIAIGGTFAFFTDRVATDAKLSTSETTVDIVTDPDASNPNHRDDLSAKWGAVNATALANYNPGDKLDLSYELSNAGDLAVDVRETFIITSSEDMKDGAPEFRLFTGAAQNPSTGAWTGGEVVVKEEKLNDKQYKYTIAPYELSGAKETVASPSEMEKKYQLVFDQASLNQFQGASCTVDYVVEAKQHTAGGDADWVTAATGSLTVNGQDLTVVPEAQ